MSVCVRVCGRPHSGLAVSTTSRVQWTGLVPQPLAPGKHSVAGKRRLPVKDAQTLAALRQDGVTSL